MASRRYPSDLTDVEWDVLESLLPAPKKRGRPRLRSPRQILDAVFYVLKTGCQWRVLPEDFPPWKTVFHYFRKWRIEGAWETMNRALRRRLRRKLGREPEPSAGIVEAQSVKATGVGGEQRGFDGGKKVRGRNVDLCKLPKRPAFERLPRRRVAERTFAWISHNRRTSKDHERLCATGEALHPRGDGAADG